MHATTIATEKRTKIWSAIVNILAAWAHRSVSKARGRLASRKRALSLCLRSAMAWITIATARQMRVAIVSTAASGLVEARWGIANKGHRPVWAGSGHRIAKARSMGRKKFAMVAITIVMAW
jgi:hypothetical protein